MFDGKDGVSQRLAARKFGVSQQYISLLLHSKTNIKCRKKMRIPHRTESQIERIKPIYRKLHSAFAKVDWILDDECYFTLGNTVLSGFDNFYTSDITSTPTNVKYAPKQKFEPKVLVWVALSPKGMTKCFVARAPLAINSEVYIKQCLKKILLPFIEEKYPEGNYIFWPDLASAHYSKETQEFYKQNEINYIAKENNPPSVPECRSIGYFLAIIKREVYKNGYKAKTFPILIRRIKSCMKNVDEKLIIELAESTSKRIQLVARNDVRERR